MCWVRWYYLTIVEARCRLSNKVQGLWHSPREFPMWFIILGIRNELSLRDEETPLRNTQSKFSSSRLIMRIVRFHCTEWLVQTDNRLSLVGNTFYGVPFICTRFSSCILLFTEAVSGFRRAILISLSSIRRTRCVWQLQPSVKNNFEYLPLSERVN